MKNVFAFTLKQHVKNKKFIVSTVVVALICLILPFLIILLLACDELSNEGSGNNAKRVFIVDEIEGNSCDYSVLKDLQGFEALTFQSFESIDSALESARENQGSIVISLTDDEGIIGVTAIIPDNSDVSYSEAEQIADGLRANMVLIMYQKLGVSDNISSLLPSVSVEDSDNSGESDAQIAREILSIVLMFVIVMLLYFMILFYGQSVSTSLVSEKTSKLSETLLLCVKPINIIFGKLFAISLMGILQIFLWIVCFVASFFTGAIAAKAISPSTTMLPVLLLDNLGALSRVFTLGAIIFTCLTVACGFIMYCSIAAICGALASKSEDLSSTNSIFVIVLVVSFIAVLTGGVASTEGAPLWMSILPFTGMLINPGLLVAGKLSFAVSLSCFALTVAFSLALMYIAAKLYKALIFYKGAFKLGNLLRKKHLS